MRDTPGLAKICNDSLRSSRASVEAAAEDSARLVRARAPLVVAAASLLTAFSHLGDVDSIQRHLPRLIEVSGAGAEELLRCKRLLNEGFNARAPHDAWLLSHIASAAQSAAVNDDDPWTWSAQPHGGPTTGVDPPNESSALSKWSSVAMSCCFL